MDTPGSISYSIGKYTDSIWSCSLQSSNNVGQSIIVRNSDISDISASVLDKEPVALNESIAHVDCWQLPCCFYGSAVYHDKFK